MNEEDRTRLGEFRQLRKEIRGSAEYLLAGIDVAKDRRHAFFGTATGKTLFKRLVFENNVEGFRKLLAQAEAMKVQEGLKKVVFGMEPTGNYGSEGKCKENRPLLRQTNPRCLWRQIIYCWSGHFD